MKRVLLAVCICLLLACLGWIAAASPNQFSLAWWSVDGGGGRSEGDGFVVNGTAGQFDAGSLTGEGYSLGGGFWGGGEVAPAGTAVYLPLVIR